MNVDTVGLMMMAAVVLAAAVFARWRLRAEARTRWPRLRVRKPTYVTLRPLFSGARARLGRKDYEKVRTAR